MSRSSNGKSGKEMADQVNKGEAGEVDFNVHARDYSRMIKMLKYGAIAALILAFLVMLIIS